MMNSKKNKRFIPTDIPIIWVNIVEAVADGAVLL
jgi:hypothetical protein